MRQYFTHMLSEQGNDYSESIRRIHFGPCTIGYRAKLHQYFVNMMVGEILSECTQYTFFVAEEYARAGWFDHLRRDKNAWVSICYDFVMGDWDPQYQRLWADSPVFTHILPGNISVAYGYSPTQSRDFPDRELWYVVFPGKEHPHGFIVDQEAAQPEFINRVGTNIRSWEDICWVHLWDESSWLFHHHHGIHLDSPWTVEQIDARLAQYRIAAPASRTVATKKRRWWQF